VNGDRSTENEPAYPHLRTLIQFDTREFFNVLSLSFQDAEFALAKKQRLVDILLQLMVDSVDFTALQVGVGLFVSMSEVNMRIVIKDK